MRTRFVVALFAAVAILAAEGGMREFCRVPGEFEFAAGETGRIPLPDLVDAGVPRPFFCLFEITESEAPTGAREVMPPVRLRNANTHPLEATVLNAAEIPRGGQWREYGLNFGWPGQEAREITVVTPDAGYGGKWKVRNVRFTDSECHPALKHLFNRGYLEWAGADPKRFNGERMGGPANWHGLAGLPFMPSLWGGRRQASDPPLFVWVNAPTAAEKAAMKLDEGDVAEDDGTDMGDMLSDDGDEKEEKADAACLAIDIPREKAVYRSLYLLLSLVDGKPGFRMSVRLKDVSGATADIRLKWGVDVKDWRDLGLKSNARNEFVYAIDGGESFACASASRLAVPERLGPLRRIEFVSGSPREQGALLLHDLFLTNRPLPLNDRPVFAIDEDAKWRPLAYSVEREGIKRGSPLDRSPKVRKTVDELGRLVSDGRGNLYCEKDPEKKPVRFMTSAGLYWYDVLAGITALDLRKKLAGRKGWPQRPVFPPNWAVDDDKVELPRTNGVSRLNREVVHQRIEADVENACRAGYRVFDIYGDGMWGYLVAQGGLDFDPEIEDTLFWLVKCLEERGMYLTWNIGYLYYKGKPWGNHKDWPKERNANLKWDAETEEAQVARRNMEQGVKKLLCTRNPYTKRSLVESPVLAYILCWNEEYFYKWGHFPHPTFRRRLLKKYGDVGGIRKAWKDGPSGWNPEWKDVSDIAFDSSWLEEDSRRGRDIAEIVYGCQRETFAWFRDYLVSIGYKGPISDNNLCFDALRTVARRDAGFVTSNIYHAHPQWDPPPYGHRWQDQSSALQGRSAFFRDCAQGRLRNRPAMITEGDIPFYSYTRYEQPFVISAYAALNGYSWIKSFSQGALGTFRWPEEEAWGPLGNFSGGGDPVKWATEYLTWHMFTGGALRTSELSFRADIPEAEKFAPGYCGHRMGDWPSSLALLGRLWVDVVPEGGKSAVPDAGESVMPYAERGPGAVQSLVDGLKAKGALDAANRTDVWRGVWESSTGELYADTAKGLGTINAPRLQGLFSPAGGSCALKAFRVTEFTEAGLLCAVATDGKDLSESTDVMLVYATDAANRRMFFTDSRREVAVRMGSAPTVVLGGRFTCTLRNANAAKFGLEALYPDGTVYKDMSSALSVVDGELRIALDTTKMERITPFFHLSLRVDK